MRNKRGSIDRERSMGKGVGEMQGDTTAMIVLIQREMHRQRERMKTSRHHRYDCVNSGRQRRTDKEKQEMYTQPL